MSKRRSILEINLTILSAIKNGVDKPTRIMYAAYMSWKPTQRMLSHLLEQGLIEMRMNTESRKSNKRYVITEKGTDVHDYFNEANKLIYLDEIYTKD